MAPWPWEVMCGRPTSSPWGDEGLKPREGRRLIECNTAQGPGAPVGTLQPGWAEVWVSHWFNQVCGAMSQDLSEAGPACVRLRPCSQSWGEREVDEASGKFGRSWAGVSLVFCVLPGTRWVFKKCLLLIIKPTLFTLGLSPKTTLHT